MNSEKILVGKKGKDTFSGYVFYPYIKILELNLPLKLISWNNGNPIFTKKQKYMNNERYNQIIDEAYENYSKEYEKDNSIGMTLLVRRVDGKSVYRKPDREMFIAMCTYDKTFSERWGLKIEERELSLDERHTIALPIWKEKYGALAEMMVKTNVDNTPYNIPTKLITVTYKDEKIEIYE